MGPEDAYLAEIRATERPIKRQRILQKACNTLPPGALTALYLQLYGIGGRALCKLAPDYGFMTSGARLRAAKRPQLVMREVEPSVRIYETPGAARAGKTLYILLSGIDWHLFVPVAVNLYLLPEGPKDVLVVRSDMDSFVANGIEGLGRSEYEVATALAEKYRTAEYSRIVVIGFSITGFYGYRLAEFLGADVAISFAGVYANDGLRLMVSDPGTTAFDPICACRPARGVRMINVVASKNEFDVLSTLRFKKMRPKLLEIHQVNAAEHNVFARLLETGTGGVFFRLALAKNGLWIGLAAGVTAAYGRFVRGIRRLFGRQKIQDWYLINRQ